MLKFQFLWFWEYCHCRNFQQIMTFIFPTGIPISQTCLPTLTHKRVKLRFKTDLLKHTTNSSAPKEKKACFDEHKKIFGNRLIGKGAFTCKEFRLLVFFLPFSKMKAKSCWYYWYISQFVRTLPLPEECFQLLEFLVKSIFYVYTILIRPSLIFKS